jgi:RNA polymerase sigma-70 factor (ECF subfamily)
MDEATVVAAAKAGDESAFTAMVERHRRELQLHCYRMMGSYEDSEDLVQETFLRAWRRRESFSSERGSSFRAWLYRIATNACLDALRRKPRRVLPWQLGPGSDPPLPVKPPADLPWLQPYPDHLLEGIAPRDEEPQEAIVARETIELAFLVTIQLLPPRQRAVLILRDVLGWSAKETASLMEASVASVNSALQRARATMKEHLPRSRLEWEPTTSPSKEEIEVVERFIDAFERADIDAVVDLLREDARATMPPTPTWHDGREVMAAALRQGHDPDSPDYVGEWRAILTGANKQPAAGFYLKRPGASEYRPMALDVFRIEDGKVAEITAFIVDERAFEVPPGGAGASPGKLPGPDLFRAFGLPATL